MTETAYNGLVNVPLINIEYKGYNIKPKLDFGNHPYSSNANTYRKGYVIVKDSVNVMPAATWAKSILEAKVMIDVLIEAEGNGDLFWKKLRELQGLDQYSEV